MGIFRTIMDKIFHHPTVPPRPETVAPAAQATRPVAPTGAPPAAPASAGLAQSVDVEAVLSRIGADKGGGGNWQSSIVDLLKLLDIDSSLNARHELAGELNVHIRC